MANLLKTIWNTVGRRKLIGTDNVMETDLKRCLSVIDVAFLGFGHTLGAAVYVITGIIVKNKAGPGAILSYMIAACAAFLSGICYSEMGTRIPKAGSAYAYSVYAVGELWAFIVGWNMILENILGVASVSRSLSGYTDSLCNGCIENASKRLTGSYDVPYVSDYIDLWGGVLIVLAISLLLFGIRASSYINNILSCINMATIIFFCIAGLFYADIKNWQNVVNGGFLPYGWNGVFSGASVAFYCFVGFDNVASAAEESMNPQKSVPRAIFGVIAIAAVCYVAITAILSLMMPFTEIDINYPIAHAFQFHGFAWGRYIVTIGAIAAMVTSMLCNLYGASRTSYSMSKDGLLFSCLSKLSKYSKIPYCSVLMNGIVTIFLGVFIDLETLVECFSIGTLVAYSMVSICVILLRYETIVIHDFHENSELLQSYDVPANSDESSTRKATDKGNLRQRVNFLGRYWPFNSIKSSNMVKMSVLAIVVSFIAEILIVKLCQMGNWWQLTMVSIFGFVGVIGFCLICTHKQQKVDAGFSVPFVPLIPVVSLFVNILLISFLQQVTFVRWLVWLAIGFVIYVAYGVRHSKLKFESEFIEMYTTRDALNCDREDSSDHAVKQ